MSVACLLDSRNLKHGALTRPRSPIEHAALTRPRSSDQNQPKNIRRMSNTITNSISDRIIASPIHIAAAKIFSGTGRPRIFSSNKNTMWRVGEEKPSARYYVVRVGYNKARRLGEWFERPRRIIGLASEKTEERSRTELTYPNGKPLA